MAPNATCLILKNVSYTLLEIVLSQGKNHQIRRMTTTIGNPSLGLIRYAVAHLNINNLNVGNY